MPNLLHHLRIAALPLALAMSLFGLAACSGGGGEAAPQAAAPTMAQAVAPAAVQATQPIRTQKTAAASYQAVVQELYMAYFGRPADPAGLTNFENALAAANAPTDIQALVQAYTSDPAIKSLIDTFGNSKESSTLYANSDTTSFVTAVFQNVLGRAPQSGGLNFWVNAIDNEGLTTSNAALSIMAGALSNTTAQGQLDAALIANRVSAAEAFDTALVAANAGSSYAGASAAASARAMLAAVNSGTNLSTFAATISSTVANLTQAISGTDLSSVYVLELVSLSTAVSPVLQSDTTFPSQLFDFASIIDDTTNGTKLFSSYLNNTVLGPNFAMSAAQMESLAQPAALRRAKSKNLPVRRIKDIYAALAASATYDAVVALVQSAVAQASGSGIQEPSSLALNAAEPQTAQALILLDYERQLDGICLSSGYTSSYCVTALQLWNSNDPAGALTAAFNGAGQLIPSYLLAPGTPACGFTYSAWGSCQSDGTQTRTLSAFSPAVCLGTPVLKQSCGGSTPPPNVTVYVGTATENSTVTGPSFSSQGLSCTPDVMVTTVTCPSYSVELDVDTDLTVAGPITGTIKFGAVSCTATSPAYSCTSAGIGYTIPAVNVTRSSAGNSTAVSGTSNGSTLTFDFPLPNNCTESATATVSASGGSEQVSGTVNATCTYDGATDVSTGTMSLTGK